MLKAEFLAVENSTASTVGLKDFLNEHEFE